MLGNYFKIAFRNLNKSKGFSAINIFGLAIGLATCLLITLFVTDELSYDRYNKNADRIFRVSEDAHVSGSAFSSTTAPPPLGPALAKDYPQIEKVVRFEGNGDMLIKKGNETIMEHNAVLADSSVFDVFTLPLVAGNPQTALVQPYSVVISESIARKYFNSTDVIGKTIWAFNTTSYKITGVMKDMPAQSHFHFNIIRSISEMEFSRSDSWLNNDFVTYLLVRPGTDERMINKWLEESVRKYLAPQLQALFHSSLDDLAKKGDYVRYTVTPLTKIHLYSSLADEFEPNGNIQYVYIFIIIAFFIMLIACVNFMNLSTARSTGRSKEVGVRKVLGSLRMNLISQFLTESILMSFIALFIALIIAVLLLPYFNQLSGKSMDMNFLTKKWLLPSLLGATILVGLMAGIYPAFFLSSFKPMQVLKGKLSTGFKTGWLRNGLVIFQFTTAIILIVGTIVIYNQLHYIRNKKLGYNRQQVLVLQNTYSLGIHAKSFKDEALNIPGVKAATMTRFLPNTNINLINSFCKNASLNVNQSIFMGQWAVDADYIPALGMEMAGGRNFSPLMPTDSSAVIINETAARMLGFSEPLNKMIYQSDNNNNPVPFRIIGVVKDFNAGSLRKKVEPIVFNLREERGAMAFRISTENIPETIARIKQKYLAVEKMAGQPFLYTFMDEDFNRLYQSEQRTGKIFVSFALLAILIACLGLFGLVTYAAEQRTKEIGIRKVLGATVSNIVAMLSKDFLKLVGIAAVIAFPIAWWAMNKWLQDFAYRIEIKWWVFAAAGLMAIMITLITVSFRAFRAALANPVKSLRAE